MQKSTTARGRFANTVRGLSLRRRVTRGIRDNAELSTTASGIPEVRLVGVDPIRVLLIGSGLAVGYGVKTQAEALTGALAEAIRGNGERGVIVQNRATDQSRIEQTVAELSEVGATACNIVVWCPSMLDILRTPGRGLYRRALMDGIRVLRETARPGAEIVLCELPIPTRKGPIEELARNVVPRFNASLRKAVAGVPDVRIAPVPEFTSLLDPEALSSDYYRRVAEQIVQSTSRTRALRLTE